jgi:hypothetical protein
VINYEEGGEHSMAHGDGEGEAMLHEIGTQKTPLVGERDTREWSGLVYGLSPMTYHPPCHSTYPAASSPFAL